MVNKTWHLVEQHGCWWAYEGKLPPAEAFTTHGRSGHLPILGPFPSRTMAEPRLQRHMSGRRPEAPPNRSLLRLGADGDSDVLADRYRAHPASRATMTTTVFESGVVVGRVFFLDTVGPLGRPWMRASVHDGQIKRAPHGYAATREEAMTAR